MKKNEKRMILILLVALVIAIILFVTSKNKSENKVEENKVEEEFVQVLDDGTKLNVSSKLNQMKKFEELEFGNIQLTNSNNQSVLLADVKNTSSTAT